MGNRAKKIGKQVLDFFVLFPTKEPGPRLLEALWYTKWLAHWTLEGWFNW